jgi:hypothetical protein
MTATFYGRQKPVVAPDFTVATLPDTQFYSQTTTYWPTFTAQTNWIVANQGAPLNIAFVSGLGDVQQDLDTNEAEWQRASSSLAVLDNSTIPHGMEPGNHDQNSAGVAAFYDQYFPVSRFQGFPWYGGFLGKDADDPVNRQNKNNYEFFSVGRWTSSSSTSRLTGRITRWRGPTRSSSGTRTAASSSARTRSWTRRTRGRRRRSFPGRTARRPKRSGSRSSSRTAMCSW